MPIPLSLSGKVALITGGSRGIGAAAVRLFVAAGARVLFNYEKAKGPSEQLVKELGADKCAAVACNLSGTETAQELVAAAVKRFGRLDILVANHGVWPPEDAPIEKMSDAQWRSTMAINLDSVFALIKHSVAQMKKQGKSGASAGHIVLVSSTAGQRGEAFHCDYAATKGALISMVKGLSTELARDAIYVNTVAPGAMETLTVRQRAEQKLTELARRVDPVGALEVPPRFRERGKRSLDRRIINRACRFQHNAAVRITQKRGDLRTLLTPQRQDRSYFHRYIPVTRLCHEFLRVRATG